MQLTLWILFLCTLLFAFPATGWDGGVITPIDQNQFYRGTPDECWNGKRLAQSKRSDFLESIPSEIGSRKTPLLFTVGIHIEPHLEYLEDFRYHIDRQRLSRLAEIVEKHYGRLTIQVQSPFTEKALIIGDPILADLAGRGHEIGLHFHEDAHLKDADRCSVAEWITALTKEIGLVERLSGKKVSTWSGGNLYPDVYDAAHRAGLTVTINYKNPRSQRIDPRFLILTPWRPVGAASVKERTRHDPEGTVVYVPSGLYPAHCLKTEVFPNPFNHEAFDYMTVALRHSLEAITEGKVNTFIGTLHPGDFGNPEDDEEEFAVFEEWLRHIIDPLVEGGDLIWTTVNEMADAFTEWEKTNESL